MDLNDILFLCLCLSLCFVLYAFVLYSGLHGFHMRPIQSGSASGSDATHGFSSLP